MKKMALHTRAIQKLSSGELLTKQAMRGEKVIIYKNIHTLSYFSMQSSMELRHLSYWGKSCCMLVLKKCAELNHVLYCKTLKNV
jgi:hypothetical protein